MQRTYVQLKLEGNIEEENNGYVGVKLNIHGSAGK
jgi:hypothetical protein